MEQEQQPDEDQVFQELQQPRNLNELPMKMLEKELDQLADVNNERTDEPRGIEYYQGIHQNYQV